jgi:hypothetical protein
MFVPGLRGLLNLTPVGLLDGAVIAAASLLPLAVNEAIKTVTLTSTEDDADLEISAVSRPGT